MSGLEPGSELRTGGHFDPLEALSRPRPSRPGVRPATSGNSTVTSLFHQGKPVTQSDGEILRGESPRRAALRCRSSEREHDRYECSRTPEHAVRHRTEPGSIRGIDGAEERVVEDQVERLVGLDLERVCDEHRGVLGVETAKQRRLDGGGDVDGRHTPSGLRQGCRIMTGPGSRHQHPPHRSGAERRVEGQPGLQFWMSPAEVPWDRSDLVSGVPSVSVRHKTSVL